MKRFSPKLFRLTANQIKLMLAGMAVIIVVMMLLYAQMLVDELRERETKLTNLYAQFIVEIFASDADQPLTVMTNIFFESVVPNITIPIVCTDKDDVPLEPFSLYSLNVNLEMAYNSPEGPEKYLESVIEEMRDTYDPIVIRDASGDIIHKFYYMHSDLITRLRLFPFIQLFVVGGFILIGYVGFSYIRRAEQSGVWAGMAKEAAHQLGTPISSLMAWVEILKQNIEDDPRVEEAVREMYHDAERLSKIADRFSKIGSRPELKNQNVSTIVEKVSRYFEYRLPRLGKKVRIERHLPVDAPMPVNSELFEWVIENLIKNAAESIETDDGIIDISLEASNGRLVILVKDNGKGMTASLKRTVFRPGFTTKKRGWGLGLSLCKRIIEDYHKGRIYIKDTAPGRGTTFAVELERDPNSLFNNSQ